MQSRDLFGVALCVLGIWFLYQACYGTMFLLMRLGALLNNIPGQAAEDKILAGSHLVAALILLGGADKIVALIYGPATTGSSMRQVP